jgi:serralysin
LLGIAVTAADATNGSWFYSTDNGSNWTALGSVSGSSARLLAADANTRLYFQPNADYNGTIASAITFRAWDQTTGSNGSLADASTNGGSTAFSTATDVAALTINPVNDAPVITSNGGGTTASVSIAENTTGVTTVTATDVDGPSLTYSIAGGADAAKFTINSSTGALAFASAPDYEAPTDVGGNNVYDVTVQVSDGSLTDSQAIAVTVTAANDNNPVITSNGGGATASISVHEGTTAVTTVTATDADLPAQTLTYSISGGPDAGKFTINGSSGVLAFVAAPSYSSPTDAGGNNVYDVTVQVSDGSLTDTQAIAVTVTGTAIMSLSNVASPPSPVPSQDVTFTATHNNVGNIAAMSLVTVENVPANTDFKLSSTSFAAGSSGLTAVVAYSNNGGISYTYTPVSGGGGAPAGYDRTVTHVRWTMTGNLSPTSPSNSYGVSFQVRIR